MRINRLLIPALALLPVLAMARPAAPYLMQHTNPDGSVVEYRTFGDEHFHYYTSADGNTILEFDQKFTELTPAVRAGKILNANSESDLDILRAENPDPFPDVRPTGFKPGGIHRMAALDYEGRTTYPTNGDVPALVILLEFADVPFSKGENTKQQYERFCNEEGYSDYGGRGSARDYFMATSNGKFRPKFEVYGPIKLEHNQRWYVGKADDPENDGDKEQNNPSLPGYQHNARLGYAIKQALEELDPAIDFSRYDLDKDGNIDNIFFFYSGYGQADNTKNLDLIWPHQWDYIGYTDATAGSIGLPRITVDGVEMRTYACSNELNGKSTIPESARPYLDGIGAFCHEYGHVLGLPDLYDTRNTGTKTPGKYTVMCDGSYNLDSTCPPLFSAYEQWVCKWLDYTDMPEDGADCSLRPLSSGNGDNYRIRLKRASAASPYYPEYYVLECRDNSGWDEGLGEYGLYIWRINYNKNIWMNNQVNTNNKVYLELLTQPGTKNVAWPGAKNQAYIIPDMNVFQPASTQKTLDIVLANLNYDTDNGNLLTFDYNKTKQMETAPVFHEGPEVETTPRTVHLRWNKVPGATNYFLTVKYLSGSREYYLDNNGVTLNEALVGDVETYDIVNLPTVRWAQTFKAYVRPYNGLPGLNTSNVITFVPSKCNEGTDVEDIIADNIVIAGGVGCIYAPEGARVFNLSGIEVGTTDLPAGIYIVNTPDATAKVVVR